MVEKTSKFTYKHLNIILNDLHAGRYEAALTASTEAIKSDPSDVVPRIIKAFIFYKADHNEDALRELDDAASLQQKEGAKIVFQTRDILPIEDTAIVVDRTKQIPVDPKSFLYIFKGVILNELKRFDEAQEMFNKAEVLESETVQQIRAQLSKESSVIHSLLDHLRPDTPVN